MAHEYWPLFGLRIRTPELELRPPTDDDLGALGAVAADGVHEPGFQPFTTPWTERPSPERERGLLQWAWRARAELSPARWRLGFVVVRDGEVVGAQDVGSEHFPVCRSVTSGSWLGLRHQGQGIGKQMRAAVLHLAFAGLGAVEARSSAFVDNPASIRVSEWAGYERDGTERAVRTGDPVVIQRFVLARERWEQVRTAWPEVEIEGLDACLPLLGLGPDLAPLPADA